MSKPSSPPPGTRPTAPRVVPSHALLGEQGKLQIEHQGERYLLRITRQGKLILTK
jgi:hemin uptake protein HemP